MLPLRSGRVMLALGVVLGAAAATTIGPACKSKPNAAEEGDAGAAPASPASPASPEGAPAVDPADEDSGRESGWVGDGGNRFRDAEPKVVVDPDGPVDPSCTGMDIQLAVAVMSPRCAIGSGRAKQLRAALENDAGPIALRQEAKVTGGGSGGSEGSVTLRLVNSGLTILTLPLSYSAKLPAFTVLAEDDRHAIFELQAPRFDVAGSTASRERPHFARIVLPPGGAAVATIAIEKGIVKRLDRGAPIDGGPPPRLSKGRYVLHVGQLLADVEAGAPARVTWDLP